VGEPGKPNDSGVAHCCQCSRDQIFDEEGTFPDARGVCRDIDWFRTIAQDNGYGRGAHSTAISEGVEEQKNHS
jgi:hypothetical protein